jgi:hypothetical protein
MGRKRNEDSPYDGGESEEAESGQESGNGDGTTGGPTTTGKYLLLGIGFSCLVILLAYAL